MSDTPRTDAISRDGEWIDSKPDVLWGLVLSLTKLSRQLERELAVQREQEGGNWERLVKEYEPKIGRKYRDRRGVCTFFGLVHADDDYYYGLLYEDGRCVLSSCVGRLDDWYEEVVDEKFVLTSK